jgi:excinuclease UvrABC helicase subunit UvrB
MKNRKRLRSIFEDFDSLFNDFGMENFLNGAQFPFGQPMKVIKGKTESESGSDETGSWTKQTFSSEDGSYVITTIVKTSDGITKSDEMSDLQDQLEIAVENQEFEKAVELRDKINKLKENQTEISSIKKELDEAIKNQDYEKAIELRDKLKNFK